MAVGAAHIALRDLRFDDTPTDVSVEELRYAERLVSAVVELQDDRIPLPAVHARVLEQVLQRSVLVLTVDVPDPRGDPGSAVFEVVGVELLRTLGVAGTTSPLQAIARLASAMELAHRLLQSAAPAPLHRFRTEEGKLHSTSADDAPIDRLLRRWAPWAGAEA